MTVARRVPHACPTLSTGARWTRRRAERRLAEWAAWLDRPTQGADATMVPLEAARGCAVAVRPVRRWRDGT